MPNGDWVALRSSPEDGLVVLDPTTLSVSLDLDFDPADFPVGYFSDVDVRLDGTILVVQPGDAVLPGFVARFRRDGELLGKTWYNTPNVDGELPIEVAVDEQDGLWVTLYRFPDFFLQHYDVSGTLLSEALTIWPIVDIEVARTDTLWSVEEDGWVQSYPYEGGAWYPFGNGTPATIAPMDDGTL